VIAYDYTVLAGTQGIAGHAKTDRMLDVVRQLGARSCCSPRRRGPPG